MIGAGALMLLFGAAALRWPVEALATNLPCDSVQYGYQCQDQISHFWGQYSPFFTVPSEIPNVVPPTCSITFAQVLSRHGARFPTASKTKSYNATIQQIHQRAQNYSASYAFLKNYTYTLGSDNLTTFGQQEMVNSGIKFFERYHSLALEQTPFVRASDEYRVVESAMNFSQGFHNAKTAGFLSHTSDPSYPYPILLISEDDGTNNTLNAGLCTAFEDGPASTIGSSAQNTWASIFVPPIQSRVNQNLPGANLSISQTIYFMDLCPFSTVAASGGAISQFCTLFTQKEWQQYDYYQSLGKYYGYSSGNPLGSTQGVGFTNELIARMTGTAVQDETSTNHTLDSNPATFPIGAHHTLFADFSHDNDMSGIFAAMGLYNTTIPLSNTTLQSARQTNGYSAAYSVPFSARAYFEKMRCIGSQEELVRIIVNDRVIPLQNCGADFLGRCTLSSWISSLSFDQANGLWNQCFS